MDLTETARSLPSEFVVALNLENRDLIGLSGYETFTVCKKLKTNHTELCKIVPANL